MMIENGLRYDAVKNVLAGRSDVVIISETVIPRVDHRKGKQYDDTKIIVAPKEGVLEPSVFPGFVLGLLEGINPVFEQDAWLGTLRTFDTLGNNRYRPIMVDVFPSIPAAQEAIK